MVKGIVNQVDVCYSLAQQSGSILCWQQRGGGAREKIYYRSETNDFAPPSIARLRAETISNKEDLMSELVKVLLGLATPLLLATPKKKVVKKAAPKKKVVAKKTAKRK